MKTPYPFSPKFDVGEVVYFRESLVPMLVVACRVAAKENGPRPRVDAPPPLAFDLNYGLVPATENPLFWNTERVLRDVEIEAHESQIYSAEEIEGITVSYDSDHGAWQASCAATPADSAAGTDPVAATYLLAERRRQAKALMPKPKLVGGMNDPSAFSRTKIVADVDMSATRAEVESLKASVEKHVLGRQSPPSEERLAKHQEDLKARVGFKTETAPGTTVQFNPKQEAREALLKSPPGDTCSDAYRESWSWMNEDQRWAEHITYHLCKRFAVKALTRSEALSALISLCHPRECHVCGKAAVASTVHVCKGCSDGGVRVEGNPENIVTKVVEIRPFGPAKPNEPEVTRMVRQAFNTGEKLTLELEFKSTAQELVGELYGLYKAALAGVGRPLINRYVTVQDALDVAEGLFNLCCNASNGDLAKEGPMWFEAFQKQRALYTGLLERNRQRKTGPLTEVATVKDGCTLLMEVNEIGGRRYWSDEIGGGVMVWDTCLVGSITLETALKVETALEASSSQIPTESPSSAQADDPLHPDGP